MRLGPASPKGSSQRALSRRWTGSATRSPSSSRRRGQGTRTSCRTRSARTDAALTAMSRSGIFVGRFAREVDWKLRQAMYAVIRTGGKQVRVAEGDVVRVERLTKETLEKGAEVSLSLIHISEPTRLGMSSY